MLLNRAEFMLMNNPLREWLQRHVEAPKLLGMGGAVTVGGVVLEVGCGNGAGLEIIQEMLGAARVEGIDLDGRMIALARERWAGRGEQVRLREASVTRIPAEAHTYDVVVGFGVLHHVPDWRAGVREIHRVLRPGGRFYAEETLAGLLRQPVLGTLLRHPVEDRFDHGTFCESLRGAGLELRAESQFREWFGWYVADKPD